MSTILSVSPTFLLRGVNYNTIVKLYNDGHFSTLNQPPGEKIKVAESIPIIAPTYGKCDDERIMSFRNNNNQVIICPFSGHQKYAMYSLYGKDGIPPSKGRCFWCLQDYDYTNDPDREAVGIPVISEEKTVSILDQKTQTSKIIKLLCFWAEDFCCDFSCAYAYCDRWMKLPVYYGDPIMINSESMLLTMFSLQNPDKELIKAKDFRLLDLNGGSLTMKEWRNSTFTYKRTLNIVQLPLKVKYLRL